MKDKWINTKERLPEAWGYYLAVYRSDKRHTDWEVGMVYFDEDQFTCSLYSRDSYTVDVRYWQPMPAMPDNLK